MIVHVHPQLLLTIVEHLNRGCVEANASGNSGPMLGICLGIYNSSKDELSINNSVELTSNDIANKESLLKKIGLLNEIYGHYLKVCGVYSVNTATNGKLHSGRSRNSSFPIAAVRDLILDVVKEQGNYPTNGPNSINICQSIDKLVLTEYYAGNGDSEGVTNAESASNLLRITSISDGPFDASNTDIQWNIQSTNAEEVLLNTLSNAHVITADGDDDSGTMVSAYSRQLHKINSKIAEILRFMQEVKAGKLDIHDKQVQDSLVHIGLIVNKINVIKSAREQIPSQDKELSLILSIVVNGFSNATVNSSELLKLVKKNSDY